MNKMIWFTSDLHLGHRSAISMCGRPFETVDEMITICNRRKMVSYDMMWEWMQIIFVRFRLSRLKIFLKFKFE